MNRTYVVEKIKEMLGDNITVEYKNMTKQNEVVEGILISDGSNVSPVIYYDDRYDDDEIVNRVVNTYKSSKLSSDDVSDIAANIGDWNWAKNNIIPTLYNKDRNEYGDIVIADFVGDIGITFKLIVNVGGSVGSVAIRKGMLDKWGVTVDDLLSVAKANINKTVVLDDMNNITLSIMIGTPLSTERFITNEDVPMKVMTTTTQNYGAATILLLADLIDSGEIGDKDYYILPSSIHEAIILNEYDEVLKNMVKEVNATQVAPQDFLSDNVFKYNSATRKIEVMV